MPSPAAPDPIRAAIRAGCAIATLSLLGAAAAEAGPRDPLYQWSDARGAVRYTSEAERIPRELRAGARVVEPGVSAAANAALLRGEPAEPAEPEPDAAPPSPDLPAVEAPAAEPGATGRDLSRIDARIAELEAAVAADEATLGDWISDPERAAALEESAGFREIAERLPRRQRELRELREHRAGAAPSP